MPRAGAGGMSAPPEATAGLVRVRGRIRPGGGTGPGWIGPARTTSGGRPRPAAGVSRLAPPGPRPAFARLAPPGPRPALAQFGRLHRRADVAGLVLASLELAPESLVDLAVVRGR